jgi:phenylalanyl-tRNA synthetase beta chain
MKISVDWLRQFIEPLPEVRTVADALTMGGLPVEQIDELPGDVVLDVEVTSNRGDCLSHLGIAREVAALLDLPLRTPERPASPDPLATTGIAVHVDCPELCPLYTARVIRNVKVGPSPSWLQQRLMAVGVRPVSNIVDITNYVMFELGQPLHAFDLSRLSGQRIVVRTARPGESLVSIDGHTRKLDPSMLVICDESGPVALAGVMGGKDSEVADDTTNLLLESAIFDPTVVRRTARALAMKSESSHRFERGLDPGMTEAASNRATQLIVELAGGEPFPGLARAGGVQLSRRSIVLRPGSFRRIVGSEEPPEQLARLLDRLGIRSHVAAGTVEAAIPSHRADLREEIDLIEEAARVRGYEKIPVSETISITLQKEDPHRRSERTLRQTLISAGYFEAMTFSFVSDRIASQFPAPTGCVVATADRAVRKSDFQLRTSLLPGLFESVRHNEAVAGINARLFEIGSVFWWQAEGDFREHRRVAIAGGNDFHATRGAVELLLRRLDANRAVRVSPGAWPGLDPSATGTVQWGDAILGAIGPASRAIVDELGLRHVPFAAELDLSALLDGAQLVPQLRPLPRFPSVQRDLSLVVPEALPYQRIEQVVQELDLPYLQRLRHVTTYRGKPLDTGTKSVTIGLEFRSPSHTLTSGEVDEQVTRVVREAEHRLGAHLRT